MNFRYYVEHRGLKPLHDRIVVKRHEEAKVGLIIIPDAYRTKHIECEVVAVGNEVKGVKAGDLVMVPGAALRYPDAEDGDYAFIREADVGGVYAKRRR